MLTKIAGTAFSAVRCERWKRLKCRTIPRDSGEMSVPNPSRGLL